MNLWDWIGRRGSLVVAGLIVAAAGTFLAGVAVEHGRSSTHAESSSEASAPASPTTSEPTQAETGDSDHPQGAATGAAGHVEATGGDDEHLGVAGLSIPTEAPATVTAAVLVSVVLAAAAAWRRERWVVGIVAVVITGFAVFDCAELAHQLSQSRAGVATLAAVTKALHIAAVAVAALSLVAVAARRSPPSPRSSSRPRRPGSGARSS